MLKLYYFGSIELNKLLIKLVLLLSFSSLKNAATKKKKKFWEFPGSPMIKTLGAFTARRDPVSITG